MENRKATCYVLIALAVLTAAVTAIVAGGPGYSVPAGDAVTAESIETALGYEPHDIAGTTTASGDWSAATQYSWLLESDASSVGAPTYSFLGDTDTGIYRIGADNLGISVGGVKQADFSTTDVGWSIASSADDGTDGFTFTDATGGTATLWYYGLGNVAVLSTSLAVNGQASNAIPAGAVSYGAQGIIIEGGQPNSIEHYLVYSFGSEYTADEYLTINISDSLGGMSGNVILPNCPQLTGGTSPAITVGADTRGVMTRAFHIEHGDLTAAALTVDVAVATLPAKAVLLGAYLVITEVPVGASVSSLTMTLGSAGAGYDQVLLTTANQIGGATSTVFGDADAELGTDLTTDTHTRGKLYSYTATQALTTHVTAVGANLSVLSAGEWDVILTWEVLP